MQRFFISCAAVSMVALAISAAAVADEALSIGNDTTDPSVMSEVQVVAKRLNDARNSIQTQTGASTYTIDAAALEATPGGDNSLLNQVIMQAPSVTQDSFGQFHVRGEHAGLQYRINGIILPEGMSGFGQSLDPRLINSMSLITGALPAEYGLRTAGIIDITTKTGNIEPGGSVSLYGGSHGTVQPSINYGAGSGALSYFLSADGLRNDLGIESPDGSSNPIHDHTAQNHAFGYLDDILDSSNRIALMFGSSVGTFQIPNLRGQQPALGLSVDGVTSDPSANLNEHQREVTQFGVVGWQHSVGDFNVQTSLVARYSSLTFVPDPLGDILFTGISQAAYKQNVAYALQSDASYRWNDQHTLRGGLFLQTDHSISATRSDVLATDGNGVPLSDVPVSIVDNGSKTEYLYSAYLQDEWKLTPSLTVNYGARLDRFTAYTSASQLSPRVNAVWQGSEQLTVHAGYSRYLSPPPFELVGGKDLALFTNTTNPPLSPGDTTPPAERANYYDIGAELKVSRALSVGVDTYAKQSINLIDEGQFGAPIILTPFNYRYGRQYGVEVTLNYTTRDFSAYLNLSAESAKGKQIESSQFNFDGPDLAWIANHFIALDHQQQRTASGGISYLWAGTRLSADFLYGSGLRADLPLPAGELTPYGGTGIPNGLALPVYTEVNVGLSRVFHPTGAGAITARLDLINAFDERYQIRNGTGVGVGAPQFGARLGLFAGVSLAL